MKKGWIISFIVLIILVVGVCIYSNNKTVVLKAIFMMKVEQ